MRDGLNGAETVDSVEEDIVVGSDEAVGLAEDVECDWEEETGVVDEVEETDDVGQEEGQEVQAEQQEDQRALPVECKLR